MKSQKVLERMYSSGIIPVVAIDDSNDVVDLGAAFLKAGVKVIEITFRTEAGAEAIRKLNESDLDICTGAGTVLTVEMAKRAVEAGAQFLVSPGFDEEIVGWAVENNVPVFPGVTSSSEVSKALKFGLKVVKFFPAEAAGGIKMLKALKGPYANMKFIPTGGISAENIGSYMELSNVVACGGSWICPSKLICGHQFEEITRLSEEAVRNIHDITFSHLEINAQNEKAPFLIGDMIEVDKTHEKGTHGHIILSVRNIKRAAAYFQSIGYTFDEENISVNEKGTAEVCFENEFGGFAIHLRSRL